MIPIQKVAKQTGVTVRTLRYYDQIRLLAASSKTEGGHRLYTDDDLRKLQQIQFFKGVGYSLKDIKEMLADPKWNWSTSLKAQLAYIMEEQTRLRVIEQGLRELISGLVVEGGEDALAIQKFIQLSSQDKRRRHIFKESLFNDKELELLQKVPSMGGDDPDSLEWIALLGQIKQHMKKGISSPKVQRIIRRMLEKQEENFSGEDEFIQKLWDARMSPAQSAELGLYPIDRDVLQFMEQAYETHMSLLKERLAPQHDQGEEEV
ncbi:MerR family transcriptional regulator [Paenibacillus bouchesdurhonensis]|uniref:MerR family transcriptional regulator n=1 Tax=Paenibacillus bouchesdurhonensis TaxID=1870990 RepID=UPI000DA60227|nr:MerR family transcriptional regulator [Paenibacillus bouchesdurhonensis]